MKRLLKFKRTIKPPVILEVPDFGPTNITDYNKFLKKSRPLFFEKWNSRVERRIVEEKPALLEDFEKLQLIGSGSFGKVFLVKNIRTKKYHAMKSIPKKLIIKYDHIVYTQTEKLILECINCPFTIRLDYYLKDRNYIYFVLPFIQGGELYGHLQRFGKFEEIDSMFYVAQVILAFEYLHFLDIMYRDLKPENILMDHTGYLKLADFGFCKVLTSGRTYTMCGTPEYLAPEVVRSTGYGKAADWWAVGILTYELSAGFTPFKAKTAERLNDNILYGKYDMPGHFSTDLKDLIRNVLQADISRRYGNLKNGVDDLKQHKWFRPIPWPGIVGRTYHAPLIPKCKGPADVRYFRKPINDSLETESEEENSEEFSDF